MKKIDKLFSVLPSLCAFIKENLATLPEKEVVFTLELIANSKISNDFLVDLGGS